MKTLSLITLFFSLTLSAQVVDDHHIFSQIGADYQKTSGDCHSYFQIIKWAAVKTGQYDNASFVFNSGLIQRGNGSFNGQLVLSVHKDKFEKIGTNKPHCAPNQGHKIIAEYEQDGQDLTVQLIRKGKAYSSGGWIFGNRYSYPKENIVVKMLFSQQNANGIFEEIDVEYSNKKNIFKKIFDKTKKCNYKLL